MSESKEEPTLTLPSSITASSLANVEVIIHPLVLLSAADHYNRVAKDTKKRVVGVLLGSFSKTRIDVVNSFAVPFEEDLKNPSVWFLDHNFLDSMFWMFKKVNTHEEIVGFYSTGPKVKENDLKIDDLFRKYSHRDPVFVIIDVRPNIEEIPTTAYMAIEEVQAEGKEITRVFKHISCRIEAEEAEEVGVEHLLRDINDPSTSHLARQIRQKVEGLTGMVDRLNEMVIYLNNVISGRLPINNQVIYNFQNILNLLPNLNVEELVKSILVKSNDMHLVIYISTLIRSVIALHNLLTNKIQYRDLDDVLDRNAGVDTKSSKKEEKDKTAAAGPASPSKGSNESKENKMEE